MADGKLWKNCIKGYVSLTYAKDVFLKRRLMAAHTNAMTAGAVKAFVKNVLKQDLKNGIQPQDHAQIAIRKNKPVSDFCNLVGAQIASRVKKLLWKGCSTFS